MVTGQLRLGVKQIHLARPTVHEQVDHRLGLGMEVRLTRFEVEHLFPARHPVSPRPWPRARSLPSSDNNAAWPSPPPMC